MIHFEGTKMKLKCMAVTHYAYASCHGYIYVILCKRSGTSALIYGMDFSNLSRSLKRWKNLCVCLFARCMFACRMIYEMHKWFVQLRVACFKSSREYVARVCTFHSLSGCLLYATTTACIACFVFWFKSGCIYAVWEDSIIICWLYTCT